MSSRESILTSIRRALATPTDSPHRKPGETENPWYRALDPSPENLLTNFKEQLERLNGTVHAEESEQGAASRLSGILSKSDPSRCWHEPRLELMTCREELKSLARPAIYDTGAQAKKALGNAAIGVTSAIALVARHGTILTAAPTQGGRLLCSLPDHHIVVARLDQLVPDLNQGYALLRQRFQDAWPSFVTNITGPSRTADIEKILVLGAHGPRELTVIVW
jgi:L-lactate dehydrogenase complex protein LldG